MIVKKEAARDYRWTNATLNQVGNKIFAFVSRDAVKFAAFGYDAAKLNDFQNAIDDFDNVPTDEELEGAKMVKTEAKDRAHQALVLAILEVTNRAQVVFANSKGFQLQFGRSDLSKASEAEFTMLAKRVHASGQRFFNELATCGLTSQHLTDLKVARDAYEDAILERDNAIAERDNATEERIRLGNALYNIITRACELGKSIWRSTSESHYNDYVLYPASQSNTPPAEETTTPPTNSTPPANTSTTTNTPTNTTTTTNNTPD